MYNETYSRHLAYWVQKSSALELQAEGGHVFSGKLFGVGLSTLHGQY